MMPGETILGACVTGWSAVCLSLLALIRMFIYSKPPGRRMVCWCSRFCFTQSIVLYQVTSDVHAIQTVAVQMIVVTVSVGSLARSLLGPLPFWTSFMFTEMLKICLAFGIGLFNVSAFLQMAIITSIRLNNHWLFLVQYFYNFCIPWIFCFN